MSSQGFNKTMEYIIQAMREKGYDPYQQLRGYLLENEPVTIAAMHEYAEQNGYELNITDTRYHHEIYLSDPRKCEPAKLKTVVRHPIKRGCYGE